MWECCSSAGWTTWKHGWQKLGCGREGEATGFASDKETFGGSVCVWATRIIVPTVLFRVTLGVHTGAESDSKVFGDGARPSWCHSGSGRKGLGASLFPVFITFAYHAHALSFRCFIGLNTAYSQKDSLLMSFHRARNRILDWFCSTNLKKITKESIILKIRE